MEGHGGPWWAVEGRGGPWRAALVLCVRLAGDRVKRGSVVDFRTSDGRPGPVCSCLHYIIKMQRHDCSLQGRVRTHHNPGSRQKRETAWCMATSFDHGVFLSGILFDFGKPSVWKESPSCPFRWRLLRGKLQVLSPWWVCFWKLVNELRDTWLIRSFIVAEMFTRDGKISGKNVVRKADYFACFCLWVHRGLVLRDR